MKRERDEIIADLLLRWEDSVENGHEVKVATLCAEHPELLNDLESKINDLKKMAWMSFDNSEDSKIQNDELIGKTLGSRYQIELQIGRGGQGRVYKAFDHELQRHVAVKVPTNESLLLGHADKFLDEARRVAKLQATGIVSVHDVGVEDDCCFIVSELIEGDNLSQVIEDSRLPSQDAVLLVAEVADNLQVAHDAGFIHRDIKPANILIDRHGKPFIADFGVASEIESLENISSGTLAYMSPEQVAKEPALIDNRSDIFSLGVVLYELLTGGLPYSARNAGALREQVLFKPPKAIEDSIPSAVKSVCLKCLSKHPSDRFHSANNLADALRKSLTEKEAGTGSYLKWLPHVLVGSAIALVVLCLGIQFASLKGTSLTVVDEKVVDEELVFDGTDRIITPVESFYPCTLEAWISAEDLSREQFVIGSDTPSFWGIGIGVKKSNPMVETIKGGFHPPNIEFKLGELTHLAAVFGETETRLYLDGKQVRVGPPTERPARHSVFVIGNLGQQHETHYFRGRIRSVKISSGQLYTEKNFTPDETLTSDAGTLVLYNSESVVGDKIVDQSGNGNDGRWESK